MKTRCLVLCFAAVLAVFATVDPLFAQGNLGGLTGTVSDSSGAVVPEVSIKVTNNVTGAVATTPSSASGVFLIP